MERFLIINEKNSYYDWHSILTKKDITPPEIKTNYVDIGGMSGSLDLTEALTGEITYKDRTISASLWTNHGTRKDRVALLTDIRYFMHGRKVNIIEPDDPEHYFIGRAKIKSESNNLAYAEIAIEFTCDPWRYALNESERIVNVDSSNAVDVVINNNGVKTLCPTIAVTGNINIIYDGTTTPLTAGNYKISDLKLYRGVNVIRVSGSGSVTFTYREATL